MPWVRFLRDYDYRHNKDSLTAYKAGMEVLVKQATAEAALAAGAAEALGGGGDTHPRSRRSGRTREAQGSGSR